MRRLVVCATLVLGAQPAFAQSAWTGRARISFDVGAQVDTNRLAEAITLTKYLEPAPVTAQLPRKSVPFFDGGLAVRLVGNLGVGLSISYLTDTGEADVTAEIPHPFFYGRPRPIAGKASGVTHSELATHLDAVYVVVLRRIDFALSGGASFFRVEQHFVTDVTYNEAYPYDTASFADATLIRTTAKKVGYNVGADVTWKFSPKWGVGGLLRYAHARVPFTANDLEVGTPDVGGLQAGGGLRLMF
jgi:outer membrane receptor protein involved in Fe transport